MSYYEKNKETCKKRSLEYYKSNRDKCIERMREYNKKYYINNIKPVDVIRIKNKLNIITLRDNIIVEFD